MRLDKFLAGCGFGTRKEVKKLIKSGAVAVDGIVETDAGADTGGRSVTVNGSAVKFREFVYIMMNKPQGFVSATEDRHYPVVTELLSDEYARFSPAPAGRLDIDTEGLLLLTNDGQLNHRLTSPSKNVCKTYFAVLDAEVNDNDISAFRAGMEFKDFTAKSAVLEPCENKKEVFIKISEGKFHQVKRMCARIGKNVEYLRRTAIGPLTLDASLAPGEYRELTDAELELLKTC